MKMQAPLQKQVQMQTLERYLTLYRRFAAEGGPGGATEASLEQVAEALFCTVRNAKLVLRKLADEGLISWQAGRGRGNLSTIAFLADREALLRDVLRAYVEAGEFNKAIQMLQTFGEGTGVDDQFIEWMSGSFGFRKERGEEADVLRLPIYKPIITVDPADYVYSLSSHLIQQIFDRLAEYDETNGRLVPGIAHYWESNEDATAWTFYLRKGVFFHDGRELTSADVAFTAERLRSGGHRNGWIMRSLRSAEILSDRTIRFHLHKPNWLFPRFACHNAMSILPADLSAMDEEAFWKRPVGTGPFRVEQWTDDIMKLRAHDAYYQARPHLDGVEIVRLPQNEAIACRIESLSWQQHICYPEQREVTEENGWIQIESKSLCTSLMSWNMRRDGPQQSAAFRLAVDRLLDRTAMAEELGGYRNLVALGFVPPAQPASAEKPARTDLDEIRALLREAGYDGAPITLCTYANHADDAHWIRRRCAEAGIPVNIRIEGTKSIHRVKHEADWTLHALVLPDAEVGVIESCEQTGSFLNELMSAELSAWTMEQFDEALACADASRRREIFAGIETRFREEAEVLFLLHMKVYSDYHPSLHGVRINALGWIDFKDIWRE